MLAAQLGHHQLARPGVAKVVVHHPPALGQAHRRVVVGGAEHDRHLPAGARAEQQGGGAGLGQLDQHGAVEPGARPLDHHPVDEAQGHGLAAGAAFVEGEGAIGDTDFEVGAVEQQRGHGFTPRKSNPGRRAEPRHRAHRSWRWGRGAAEKAVFILVEQQGHVVQQLEAAHPASRTPHAPTSPAGGVAPHQGQRGGEPARAGDVVGGKIEIAGGHGGCLRGGVGAPIMPIGRPGGWMASLRRCVADEAAYQARDIEAHKKGARAERLL